MSDKVKEITDQLKALKGDEDDFKEEATKEADKSKVKTKTSEDNNGGAGGSSNNDMPNYDNENKKKRDRKQNCEMSAQNTSFR